MKFNMFRSLFFIFIYCILTIFIFGCDPNVVRQHAATLAIETGKLNDNIEELTTSRQEIEAARLRLTNKIDLSSLEIEQEIRQRLAIWSALKDDAAFKQRLQLFGSIKSYSDVAISEDDALSALNKKVVDISDAAKGQRSEQLSETVKELTALSKETSLVDNLMFLANTAKSVRDSIKQAKKDSANASEAASIKTNNKNP